MSNVSYIVYDKATGKILRYGQCAAVDCELQPKSEAEAVTLCEPDVHIDLRLAAQRKEPLPFRVDGKVESRVLVIRSREQRLDPETGEAREVNVDEEKSFAGVIVPAAP